MDNIIRPKTIFVTGGAGFIGSALIRFLINETNHNIVNIDKLTYAGNLNSLNSISDSERYNFELADIVDKSKMLELLEFYKPDFVMHLAAESHVDRSIDGPDDFIQTNIIGTFSLLQACHLYYKNLPIQKKSIFRFHHISTDEVYGDLGESGLFTEDTPYAPSSPYSASKASSDHLVRAWERTYNLPILVTNCSNNYGPFHFPEKLIPLIILNAIDGKPLPVYGDGSQIRDWLYVEDHVRALYLVVSDGSPGETYNIGGFNEKRNIDVVNLICELLEEFLPKHSLSKSNNGLGFDSLITHVTDRPGHDIRYAIDASKVERELGWRPKETFETGMRKTVQWYLSNMNWCEQIKNGSYKQNFQVLSSSDSNLGKS